MGYFLLRVFIKITGWPLDKIFFSRKVYFEEKAFQKRKLKGGVLLVSNHKSFWDCISYCFLFFFRLVHPIVSYEIYNKNRLLRFFLNVIGAIPLGQNPFDYSYFVKAEALLKRGQKILVFPEAHFIKDDELGTFYPSYVYLAYRANVPIIPLYTDGNYSFFRRNRVMIGKKIDVNSLLKKNGDSFSRQDIDRVNLEVRSKVGDLRKRLIRQKKNHWFRPSKFWMDFGRVLFYLHTIFVFRVKVIGSQGKRTQLVDGPIIIAPNHTSFLDPFLIIKTFWRRRVYMLVAKEVYGLDGQKKRFRTWGLNNIGCIRIDRSAYDVDAIDRCSDVLLSGYPLLVFPEGKINRNGQLSEIKEGASILANRTDTEILPIYIQPAKHWYNRSVLYLGERISPSPNKSMKGVKEVNEKIALALKGLERKAHEE